jgi:hypothetical protein
LVAGVGVLTPVVVPVVLLVVVDPGVIFDALVELPAL